MALLQTTYLFVQLKKGSECGIVKENVESRRALWRTQHCGKQESFKEKSPLKISSFFGKERKDG